MLLSLETLRNIEKVKIVKLLTEKSKVDSPEIVNIPSIKLNIDILTTYSEPDFEIDMSQSHLRFEGLDAYIIIFYRKKSNFDYSFA